MTFLAELIGESQGIKAVREQIGRLLERRTEARRFPPILLQGETGTGKGVLASAIHRASPRTTGPFVGVNCAAIPETLLEAELFGFERGAFTDARQSKAGLFQAANRGTLFLDEVGLLPGALQAKLLTALEEQAVRRIGSTRSEPVDLWILSASNHDLAVATRERRFREDLYHRLAVLTVWLPPLRERGQDILLLAEHFLARACQEYGLPEKTLTTDARTALLAYPWPGNVRELANVIERVALLSEDPRVTAKGLGLPDAPMSTMSLDEAVGSLERVRLLEALRQTNWNISRAAARLGLPRGTLRSRIQKHGLRPAEALRPTRRQATTSTPPAPAVVEAAPGLVSAGISVPASLRWEPRRLTLLRAGLSGPSPTDVPAEASGAVQVLIEKAQSFGGRVEEASPTGIVAAFGIEPVEDAPARAALAAMAIQKAEERARREGTEPFTVRMGIHTGRFLVGQVTGTSVIDLEAKRQAGIILEALLERAEPNTIWVSDAAARFLERRFDLVSSGALEPGPGQGFRLAGRERTSLGLRGRMARFVGRDEEIELLWNRLISTLRGHGQVVGISGEAGIGKSRLLFEFRQRLTGEQVTYLEGRCVSYGSNVPYLPVLDILQDHCGVMDADSPGTVADKVHRTLEELALPADEEAPSLLHLLGVKSGTEAIDRLDPEILKAETFGALRKLSLAASRQRPQVLAVEDLHWIDTISEEYLASLVESLAGAPILLLVTYRSGYRPPWIEKSYATHVALQPLSPPDSLTMVQSVLPGERLSDPLTRIIVEKAEGNPFFLEELARAVGEQGDSAIPDTIQAVLLARIDRLPPEEKVLLQSAAVIGKDVPFALLRAVAELSEEELRRRLLRLQAGEFIYETSLFPDLEYTFKHALTHEVAYGNLVPERRRALHARIVEAIEQLYPGRLTDQVDRLAHHAFRGEVWDNAVAYLRQAGTKAAARSAHREAVALFQQALGALERLPRDRQRLEEAIDLHFDLVGSLYPFGELDAISGHLHEAEALAITLDDQRRLGTASAYLSTWLWRRGDQDRAAESGRRALAIAQALGDFGLEVWANLRLGQVYYVMGNYPVATDFLRKDVDSLQGDLIHERFGIILGTPSVISRMWLVFCLVERGEFAEGIALAEDALRLTHQGSHTFDAIAAYSGLGLVYLRQGQFQQAIPPLERAHELCRELHVSLLLPEVAPWLGYAYLLSQRVDQGLPLLEQAVEQAASLRMMVRQSVRVAFLGEAYLEAGRREHAIELARRALDLAREHQERGHEAWALRLLAETAARRDPPVIGEAEAFFGQSIALSKELGMRPLLARCSLGLGRLYRQIGEASKAREHLIGADALFSAMEMEFWREQSQAELKALG